MTVQELIDELMKIEDKSKPVIVYDNVGDLNNDIAVSEEEFDENDSVLIY